MVRRFPPLISLRDFEAVARHLSFTKAAEELNVTQAAVSHQVKKLEEWLGAPLFLRLNRSIRLTKEGEAYAEPLKRAFDIIADATQAVLEKSEPNSISIATFDSIAANWLAPRIRKFQSHMPDSSIKIETRNYHTDFSEDDVDVEIRYGDGDWPGQHVTKISDEHIFPVCSKRLLGRKRKLDNPDGVKKFELLHDEMVTDWADWLRAAGGDIEGADKGLRYNHSHIVIQAALAGEGMALGRSMLVADELERGNLIAPFDIKVRSKFSYYLVCPKDLAETDWVCAFREWLLTEAAETNSFYK